jgi:hypothetical protein
MGGAGSAVADSGDANSATPTGGGAAGDAAAGDAAARDAVAEADQHARSREERQVRDAMARVDAALGDAAGAARAAEAVAEDFARAGEIRDAAAAVWLAGQCWDTCGDGDQSVYGLESALEGFHRVPDRVAARNVGNVLVSLLHRLGREADAARIAESLAD